MVDSVDKAEATCRELIVKRDQLIDRGTELGDNRRGIAFEAQTGDASARKRLDAINQEAAKHTSELASLDAAIAEATLRLDAAREAATAAADREAALTLRKVLRDFEATGDRLSKALAAFVSESNHLAELVTSIKLGDNTNAWPDSEIEQYLADRIKARNKAAAA